MSTHTYNPLCYNQFQRVLLACLAVLAMGGAGCFPSSSDKADASGKKDENALADSSGQGRRGAEVMIGKKPPGRDLRRQEAETAYWRDQYKKNRTVPPRDFTVKPAPPRNNNFGEFEEDLYASLDAQPRLPGMPGGQDLMPMMGGGAPLPVAPGDYPQHRAESAGIHSYPPQARTGGDAAPRRGMAAATARTLGVAESGLTTESRFYPIEQLVFGGEFPDLDKPELYRLMPKDVISITVKEHPEFSGKLEIQPDGTVRVPNLPDLIRLRGLTVDEASGELRQALQIYVKGECVVRVQANRARGGYYFVFGDVLQPGRFPMGLEPIKLSDAVLAANWETNLARVDADGDELGPAFPTATPRGKFIAPRTADMANVMLVTPHRSRPVRTSHDVRQALLGMMREDPVIRPGQIIIVPSLDPRRNAALGLDMPEGESVSFGGGNGGFSKAGSSARLPGLGSGPDGNGYAARGAAHEGRYDESFGGGEQDVLSAGAYGYPAAFDDGQVPGASSEMMDCLTPVQRNMARSFDVQATTLAEEPCDETYQYGEACYDGGYPIASMETVVEAEPVLSAAEEWRRQKPRESAIPVPGTEVTTEKYNAMAGPRGDGRALPKTNVSGIAAKDKEEPGEMVELKPRRGRRLRRPGDGEESAGQTVKERKAKTLDSWNMGF